MSDNKEDVYATLKYIIIGDTNVGKSKINLRFVNEEFVSEYQATVGVEFGSKVVEYDNKKYKVQVWDTAGQEQFKSIARNYYKNTVCTLVVYDITSRDSFNNVKSWIDDCKQHIAPTTQIIILGNKCDLEDKREVSTEEGNEFAESRELQFYETSAKDGTNVEKVFRSSVEKIAKNIAQKYYDLNDESCGIRMDRKGRMSSLQLDKNKVIKKKKNVAKISCLKLNKIIL